MQNIFYNVSFDHWVIKFLSIVFIIIVINLFTRVILSYLKKQSSKTYNMWDDCVIDSIYKPFTFLVWIMGIIYAIEFLNNDIEFISISTDLISNVKRTGIIIVIALFLISISKNFQIAVIHKNKQNNIDIDESTYEAITKIIRLSVIIISGLIILQTFGFSVSRVLAFGGIGGVAVGFAAKDMLATFFGGLMIYLDRPVRKGDWIRSPDRELEGTVENIIFMNIIVENPSRMTHRRIREIIGLRYKDMSKMEKIVNEVKEMITNHDQIDHKQITIVNFDSYNDSSIDFFVNTFANTTEWVKYHEIKQDVLMKVGEIIEKNGAEIAFPTRVHITE